MSQAQPNPLVKHFRQPALYLKLPSSGKWYADNAVDLTASGEIPIYPMTARDELTIKTPDALMNGESTAAVLKSCCPSIRDPWAMPIVDLDPILIAIRIASYGKGMDFTTNCPHCNTEQELTADLNAVLSRVAIGDWTTPVSINGLTITLRPQNYREYNDNNRMNFDEQRVLSMLDDESMTVDDRKAKFTEMFNKLLDTGMKQVSKSIASIQTETGEVVTEQDFIIEFLNNCDRSIWNAIKDKLDQIRESNNYAKVTTTCENQECQKEYTSPFVFDQANFFA